MNPANPGPLLIRRARASDAEDFCQMMAHPEVYATVSAELFAVGGTSIVVMAYDRVAVYGPVPVLLSVAVVLKLKVPSALGVPVMAPLAALRPSPPGSAPAVTT